MRPHLLLLLLSPLAHAQFECTFSGASDESACVSSEDNGKHHCVWCALSEDADHRQVGQEVGVCVSETQAEAMEENIPLIHCDRYDDTDDDGVTPDNDDAKQDDDTPATDDELPDNYWKCLKAKDEASCTNGCTWCDTPAGFGVCMTGPSAEAAKTSAWFTCKDSSALQDPMDPSCALVFLQDPSKETCEAAVDADGNPCEFCSLQDSVQVCLNADQAEMGEQFGFECGEESLEGMDPMDPSCALVFLQDPSKEACEAAVDADGTPCRFCDLQGAVELCVNADQAEMGEQFGLECGEGHDVALKDPMDPSCALVYLQDPSKEACEAAVDADGNPCEFCSLQDAVQVCLNADQAEMGEQFGLECGEDSIESTDPMDPSCALVYLQDPSKEACEAAVDADGNPCEFCSLQDAVQVCLNADQAEMGEQFGLECGEDTTFKSADPMDPSCALVFLQDPSKEACEAAVDADGNPCEFCSLQDSVQVCLNADQAEMGEQFGLECGEETLEVTDPADISCSTSFWADPSKDTCMNVVDVNGAACQYCSIPGSLVLCVNDDQASLLQVAGMQCESIKQELSNVLDSTCMETFLADPLSSTCVNAVDQDGNACSYCHLKDAFGLCLSDEQAELASEGGLECNSQAIQDFPDDLIECLEHYEEGDCRDSACTWCNTQVGMGFCVTESVAETTKQFPFFDCEFGHSPLTASS